MVATVPARFTSQTCAACGVVDARSRGSQARCRLEGTSRFPKIPVVHGGGDVKVLSSLDARGSRHGDRQDAGWRCRVYRSGRAALDAAGL
ncbi:hypothetical protein [Methylorubrum populi]|uniref:hypothetical protein n=1 Tax=Methylorubrum populi TaxID=223967 RepID=UPI003D15441C